MSEYYSVQQARQLTGLTRAKILIAIEKGVVQTEVHWTGEQTRTRMMIAEEDLQKLRDWNHRTTRKGQRPLGAPQALKPRATADAVHERLQEARALGLTLQEYEDLTT